MYVVMLLFSTLVWERVYCCSEGYPQLRICVHMFREVCIATSE